MSARIERLQQTRREFPRQYEAARALWLEGTPAVFPAGTYWLRVFANVRVEDTADPPPPPFAN